MHTFLVNDKNENKYAQMKRIFNVSAATVCNAEVSYIGCVNTSANAVILDVLIPVQMQ